MLKVAFYGTKSYDKIFFEELAKDKGEGAYNCDITYFDSRLTAETVHLCRGFDAVCMFVNDEAPRPVVEQMKKNGIRLILLRCAGFNNVDLDAAKEWRHHRPACAGLFALCGSGTRHGHPAGR